MAALLQLCYLASQGFGSPDSSSLKNVVSQQKAELAKLRQDMKDLGAELFKSNEKVTKLSVDCKTLLFNREKLNALVADQQREIVALKEESLRRDQAAAHDQEVHFHSFPLSEVDMALARSFRERLITRYNISRAFVREAGKVASFFLQELCQKFYDLNLSKGFPLDFEPQEAIRTLPRTIPDWEGDASETPDFEWWQGIWEEAVAAEAGALAETHEVFAGASADEEAAS